MTKDTVLSKRAIQHCQLRYECPYFNLIWESFSRVQLLKAAIFPIVSFFNLSSALQALPSTEYLLCA